MVDVPEIKDWPWATIFIEIALRAVRRVHYEHGMWGIGRQWEMNRLKARRINMGQGIELADERTVCAAITQEFINSPSLTGLWVEEDQDSDQSKEERYFTIDREMEYTDKSKKVDIFIRKYRRENNNLIPVKPPCFIEAKRARRWVPDINSGTAECADLQHQEVKKDIDKLRAEMVSRTEEIYSHVLVWGVHRNQSEGDHPLEFFQKFDGCVKLHKVRWLPLEWTCPSVDDIQCGRVQIPLVDAALWIALAQVFRLPA